MSSGQRVAVSLLSAVFIFAVFMVAAFSGLFSLIEARFYQPSLMRGIHAQLLDVSETLDAYLKETKERFYTEFAENAAVQESFSFEQSAKNIRTREDAAGNLSLAVPALTGIRVIETGGKKVHYSTFPADVLQRGEKYISYRPYKDLKELPYADILCDDGEEGKIISDPERGRILFSFPFHDSYSAYRGTIVFYTAASDFARVLVQKKLNTVTDSVIFTGTREKPIFVLGFPNTGREIVENMIAKRMSGDFSETEKLVETEHSDVWMLFSRAGGMGIYVSRLHEEKTFVFSDTVKTLLLISVFITSFLILFLILNIKQDDMFVIRNRIKNFQIALINDYLNRKEEVDWAVVYGDIKRRKLEINGDIKRSLGNRAKRHAEEVDLLLTESWEKIAAAMNNQSPPKNKAEIDSVTAQIKAIVEEILSRSDLSAVGKAEKQRPASSPEADELVPPDTVLADDTVPSLSYADADVEELCESADFPVAEEIAEADEELEEMLPADVEDTDLFEEFEEAEDVCSADEELCTEPEAEYVAKAADDIAETEPEAEPEDMAEPPHNEVPLSAHVNEDTDTLQILDDECPAHAFDNDEIERIDKVFSAELDGLEEAISSMSEDIFAGTESLHSAPGNVFVRSTDDTWEFTKIESAPKEEAPPETPHDDEHKAKDDIFNEELKIGDFTERKTPASGVQKDTDEMDLSDFKIGTPDFSSLNEEVAEADFIETIPFSFTFGTTAPAAAACLEEADQNSILEKDGLFVVSEEAGSDEQTEKLDTEFQTLVDSVL